MSVPPQSLAAPVMYRQRVRASTLNWHAGSWAIIAATVLLSGRWEACLAFAILFGLSQLVANALRGNPTDVRMARRIHAISLFVTLFAMLVTSLLFYANLGTTLGENDEAKTHFWTLESAEDLRYSHDFWVWGDMYGQTVPLTILTAIVTPSFPVPVESHAFAFLEKIYTAMWASWIPVVIYFALRRRLDVHVSSRAAIALALFPAMLHFGSLAVRDALVTFNYTFFLFLLTSRTKPSWNMALRVVLLLYTYAIRSESGAFLGVAWVGYECAMACHYALRNDKRCAAPMLTGVVVCVLGIAFVSVPKLISDLTTLHERYSEFNVDGAGDGSLGMRVRTLPQPLPPLVLAAVGTSGMIPPATQLYSPFIEKESVDDLIAARPRWSWSPGRLLKAATPLLWQMSLPFMWIGYVRRDRLLRDYPEFFAAVFVSFGYLCVIPQFTIDVGKLAAGYPFPLSLAFVAYQTSSPIVRRRTFLVFACWVMALAAMYLYMKSR